MGATAHPSVQHGQNGAAPTVGGQHGTVPQPHYVGERDFHRSLFDDKIACMHNTMYPLPAQAHLEVALDKTLAWAKTNRNYFISKACELDMILKYVEGFGTDPITPGHVEDMGNRGFMTELSLPKLSRDICRDMHLG